jgi:integrase
MSFKKNHIYSDESSSKYFQVGQFGQKLERIKFLDENVKKIQNLRDKLFFSLIFELGLTSFELVNLRKKDFDFGNNLVIVGNNDDLVDQNLLNTSNRIRKLKLSKNLLNLLKNYLIENLNNNSNYLFSTRQSPQISVRRLEQIVKSYHFNIGDKSFSFTPQEIRNIFLEKLIKTEPNSEIVKEKSGLKILPKKKVIEDRCFENVIKKLTSLKDSPKEELVLKLFYYFGLSTREVCGIKISDIMFSSKILIIRDNNARNNRARAISIDTKNNIKDYSFYELLCKYIMSNNLDKNGYLFVNTLGNQESELNIRSLVSNLFKSFNFDGITPQVLRNSHIYNSAKQGESLNSISERTGILNLNSNNYISLTKRVVLDE